MKVCAVTTWTPHKDGIALYSKELYTQISKLATLQVIVNTSKQTASKNSIPVLRSWNRGITYPLHVFRAVFKTRCHIIHLQHGWLLHGCVFSALLFPVLLFFFRLSDKPRVVTMHTVIRKNAKIYNNFMLNWLAKTTIMLITQSIFLLSDKVIVHNQLMKQILQTEYGAEKQKVAVIPHGTKTAPVAPFFRKKNNELCILFLGFLRKEKGIKHLIEAFKTFVNKYPNAKLVIVGTSHAHENNSYSQDLKHSIPLSLQNQVIFSGFVNETTLEGLIWESDIIVLQSTEPYYVEASGTLAAVADYSKALVCSKVPKFQSELQNKKNCLFVNPLDSTDLSNALVLLAENKELRRTLGKNVKAHFSGRSWNAVAKKHLAVYHQVIQKN